LRNPELEFLDILSSGFREHKFSCGKLQNNCEQLLFARIIDILGTIVNRDFYQ
jgi:hypothetical protein